MKKLCLSAVAAVIAAFAFYVPGGAPAAMVAAPPISSPKQTTKPAPPLSVMTYNVKGLPWPAALGRAAALSEIGRRFARLRRQGIQPNVVLLQEAFIPQAKALGAIGGYRYVAIGPQPADVPAAPTASLNPQFRAGARWLKGEDEGKWIDGGLMILSDYPIVATAKMAFPDDACAGFDCLSAKGAVLARIRVPGLAKPIAIVDTHLNSRHSTGVSMARANAAYAWQAAAVRRFVAKQVEPDTDVIFGGDFNVGHDPQRLAAAGKDGGFLPDGQEAIATMVRRTKDLIDPDADLLRVRDRGKDKEYFRSGNGSKLKLRDVEVPFGADRGGFDLSDHIGFIATFDL